MGYKLEDLHFILASQTCLCVFSVCCSALITKLDSICSSESSLVFCSCDSFGWFFKELYRTAQLWRIIKSLSKQFSHIPTLFCSESNATTN